MNFRKVAVVFGSALALSTGGLAIAHAAGAPMSDADKAFVAKVSQGGMYEVELGKVAEKQGATQDIRDQGNTEAHDHTLVGDKLKSIVTGAGMEFPTKLDAEFQGKLDKITAMSGAKFDETYLKDMKTVHAGDGAAFAKEARSGTNPELKAFAAETFAIVQRHIGELDAKTR